ncbi:MAG: ZIP family metal transporter [Candidatus Altiarchaeota archaeon]|nr:ZIP family metal transporter [Candidatus Altiarchaeota archaeon]
MSPTLWALLSVFLVSLVSFVGAFTLSIKDEQLEKILLYLVSLSAGALLGGAFFHLIPEAVESAGFGFQTSLPILLGIVSFFVLEKFLHWRHHHVPHRKGDIIPLAMMNLVGDGFHNFIDGLILGASYLVSIPTGVATTIAIVFHEIPQEIGDFGVLLHSGLSRGRALLLNFVGALFAVLGTIVALVASSFVPKLTTLLIPFAAGGFVYIAGSDLIPEMHKEVNMKKSAVQLVFLILGMFVMFLLGFLE